MGGDHAPAEAVHGAIEAIRSGIDVVLVGDRDLIEPLVKASGTTASVVHASETIAMGEDPAAAIRVKKDASVSVAARLVASGEAAGFVSAGSTGAAMAAAAFVIGRLAGVQRPAIASIFPTGKVVIDSGANLDVRPEHLVQFAVMGSALAQSALGIPSPKVGLLNIGEEDGKGRDLEKEAFKLLLAAPVNFIGNVEGRDVVGDRVDVIVTDGFSGNVLLKGAEGSGRMLVDMVMEEAEGESALRDLLPALDAAFARARSRVDPETYGGAHLVGTKGVVVIAHGSSSRVAIANALRMAASDATNALVERIAAGENHVPNLGMRSDVIDAILDELHVNLCGIADLAFSRAEPAVHRALAGCQEQHPIGVPMHDTGNRAVSVFCKRVFREAILLQLLRIRNALKPNWVPGIPNET